jgi:HSP20 family molecular chaperone IbpA
VLVVEAPIIMDKYSYRRSAYDPQNKSQSPIRITQQQTSPNRSNIQPQFTTSSSRLQTSGGPNNNNNFESSSSHRQENKTSSSSSSTTTHHKVVRSTSGSNLLGGDDFAIGSGSGGRPFYTTTSQSNLNQSQSPELIAGYPVYDSNEACVVYKFDLSGFDQSEIHLTITSERILEIRACKEIRDELGKIYREFKREIHLEPEVDDKLIKNVLHDGILTLKIPKANRPDGLG